MVKKITTQETTQEKTQKQDSDLLVQNFNALPLRDTVIYPFTTITILVGRQKSDISQEEFLLCGVYFVV